MNSTAKIGWVVDAQADFMDPEGRLYVKDLGDESDPGSTLIVGTLERAVEWMYDHCALVVFTGDWHGYDDEEIDPENPDPLKGTYPPHCMGRSADPSEQRGAEIIAEIRPTHPLILEIGASDREARALAAQAVQEGRPVFIRKNRFDVFHGNPATEAFLAGLGKALERPLEFFVAGVARDVCVTQAVDGMQARSLRVTALRDATWGLGLEPEDVTLARWKEKGQVIAVDDLPHAP
jgi:nicotinamidase/pyrazinamidase